jgi:DNA polymerase I-like protein with 3'-5' exonuclease and polymerase domains
MKIADNITVHIDKFPKKIKNKQLCAIDLELFGAEEHRLHRPTGKFACCTFTLQHKDEYDVYLITRAELLLTMFPLISAGVWVMQNASFDVRQLRRWSSLPPRKKLWDTLIIDRLLWAGYYDTFSLEDMMRRYCDKHIDKSTVKTFSDTNELTQDQIVYAAMDGVYTLQVQDAQAKEIKNGRKDVWKVYKNIDLPAMWAFLDFQGFRLDVEAWENLAHLAEQKEQELDDFDLNPRSPQQVLERLRATGFARLKNTQAGTLQKAIESQSNTEAAELARKILEYRSYKKLASTYGMNFINNYIEEEDDYHVIVANYQVNRAETGRSACSSPNLQNIPVRKAPEYRAPWIARPGNKLIVMDRSAQEASIHAYLTQDQVLVDIFKQGKDVYTEAYNLMYDANIKKSDPRRSDIGKPAFLGATYGQTAPGIAERYNMPLEAAEDMQARFWSVFRESASWCAVQQNKRNFTETIYGRRTWLNPYSGQCGRNALNNPHQGSAARRYS